MELRICNTCNIEKELEFFALSGKNNNKKKQKCKDCCNKYGRLKYKKNKYKETRLKYKEEHKDKIRNYTTEYFRKRKSIDPLFKMKCNLKTLIWISFHKKEFVKNSKVLDILGCSYEFFKEYIESQFIKGMNWENIHLDHIKPLYLANTYEEIYKLNHYTNFQPLFAIDNLRKNKNYES